MKLFEHKDFEQAILGAESTTLTLPQHGSVNVATSQTLAIRKHIFSRAVSDSVSP